MTTQAEYDAIGIQAALFGNVYYQRDPDGTVHILDQRDAKVRIMVEDIARIFDVPPALLGRSRARSKQLHRAYRHRCLARRRRNR